MAFKKVTVQSVTAKNAALPIKLQPYGRVKCVLLLLVPLLIKRSNWLVETA